MSYSPLWTSEAKVEGLLQLSITVSTEPTTAQVLVWIEEVEGEIVERVLGSHTATDQYLDVPQGSEIKGGYDWVYNAKQGTLKISLPEGMLIPLAGVKMPIIAVTSLAKNDENLESAPSWTTLTEWNGTLSGTSFMLLKSGTKDLGYALFFYDNEPEPGPKRLKMTYTYGWNVRTSILSDYCTLRVAERVLIARMNAGHPPGIAGYSGPDMTTYANTEIKTQLGWIRDEADRIEKEHFPSQSRFAVELV